VGATLSRVPDISGLPHYLHLSMQRRVLMLSRDE
jgi:hypothetical protein